MEKFITLILLKGLGNDKPDELIVTSIIRGRFAELIVAHMGLMDQASNSFLIGMFSLIEALVEQPMDKILSECHLMTIFQGVFSGNIQNK